MNGEIPVACTLLDAERREREATLIAQFKSAVIATEELPDGYVFHLPGGEKWMRIVSELIVAERECCPFLTFDLVAHANMGLIDVQMTGPPGTVGFLEAIFCKPEGRAHPR
jgi:hypothetical protein